MPVRIVMLSGAALHREALMFVLRRLHDVQVLKAVADAQLALSLTLLLSPDALVIDHPSREQAAAVERAGRLPCAVVWLGEGGCTAGGLGPDPTIDELYRHLVSLSLGDRPQPTAAGRVGSVTPREREICQLIVQGLSNKEIAAELNISLPTVKNHVHRVLAKLCLRRRTQLIGALRHSATGGRRPDL
jgi:DNA-binding NarL/FixJ family response regulator